MGPGYGYMMIYACVLCKYIKPHIAEQTVQCPKLKFNLGSNGIPTCDEGEALDFAHFGTPFDSDIVLTRENCMVSRLFSGWEKITQNNAK